MKRRHVLQGIGAMAGATLLGGRTLDKKVLGWSPEDVKKFITVTHAEDIQKCIQDSAAGAFFGYLGGSLLHHGVDPWEHDPKTRTATLRQAPWGGTCVIAYETHGQSADHSKPVARKYNLLTFEGVIRSEGTEKLPTPSGTFDSIDAVLDQNRDTPMFGLDAPVSRRAYAAGASAYVLKMITSVVGTILITRATTPTSLAIGLYLGGHSFVMIARLIQETFGIPPPKSMAAFSKVWSHDIVDPSTLLLLKIRNCLAAEKMYGLGQLENKRTRKEIDIFSNWGLEHAGLETEIIASQEERLKFLRRWAPLILFLIGNVKERKYLWTCDGIRGDGSQLKRDESRDVEIESLREIFDGAEVS